MIWDSVPIMAVIDIIIIAMTMLAFWIFLENRELLKELQVLSGVTLILIGLLLLAVFYLADLSIMFLLPFFMPMDKAMDIMRELHLNYMWLVSAASISSIVIGLVYLIKRLFPRIVALCTKLEETQKELKKDFTTLKETEQKLLNNEDELKELTLTDALTGVANRRGYDKTIRSEWYRAKRMATPLSLIMLDIDFFKNYNDKYGHIAGDQCLKKIAAGLSSKIVRAGDVIARYGGEEFVIILPGSDKKAAVKLAEILREEVESLNIEHIFPEAKEDRITISLGVAATKELNGNIESLLLKADSAMYEAKREGRNKVKVA